MARDYLLDWNIDQELLDLQKTIKKVGKMPQKHVTRAVKRASGPVLSTARLGAPKDSGELAKGLVLKGEKHRKKGKKVYDIVPDRAKNDLFVKISKAGKRAYYPASQEYGFFAKNGRYIPGYHYLANAAAKTGATFAGMVISYMMGKIEEEWVRKNA
ncbi:MAG: HK97 gp10 family phage protein [Clostridia bacterium]|nr:HK97 gp10 family phage protein [Clostridia bacterium]